MTVPTTKEPAVTTETLQVAVDEPEPWTRRLAVTVAPERVEGARASEREKLGKSVNLDGFRPGNVPDRVLENRFGPVIRQRTVDSVVEDAYREAARELDLQPVSQPEVTDVDYREGEGLSFQVEVEVVPTVDLERTGGFQIIRPEVHVPDEKVDEVIERLRDDHAVWQPVERRPEAGDQVSVQIRPEASSEHGEEADSEPYRFELGEGYAIPDVEEAIRTLEPGEEGAFDVRFPEEFDDPELAGGERRLNIELLGVKEKDLPPLDDAFAAQVGDFESVEALRDAVRDDLHRHREEEAEESVRRDLLDHIVEANPFEVPETMVDDYLDRLIDAPQDAEAEQVQEARRSLRPRAEQEIKRQLVMDQLIEAEGFEATEEEVEERLDEIASREDLDVGEVRRRLTRESRMEGVRQHIAAEKLFEKLKTDSTIKVE